MQRKGQKSYSTRDAETATNPVPESEDVLSCDTKGVSRRVVGADCAQVCLESGPGIGILHLGVEKFNNLSLDSSRVQHSLRSSKGLRDDDKHGFFEVDVSKGSVDVDGVDVGQELKFAILRLSLSYRVKTECLVNELGAQVATTNSNGHYTLNRLISISTQGSASDFLSKSLNLLLHGNNFLLHLGFSLLGSQLDVPDLAALGRVHDLSGKHGFDSLRYVLVLGDLVEESEAFSIDFRMSVVHPDFVEHFEAKGFVPSFIRKQLT